jgi:hypothetical protein
MKASPHHILRSKVMALALILLACFGSAEAQDTTFPYPSVPDTLRKPEARADYLLMHFWDNFDFSDSTRLYAPTCGEQGFVDYVDLLGRFGQRVGPASAKVFIDRAWSLPMARRRVDDLLDHYLDDSASPVRNDRTYILLLNAIADNGNTGAAERERYRFKARQAAINLPGDTARDFSFTADDGTRHSIREYRDTKVCLFFYDPDCENCHTVWAWMQSHPLPADIKVLRVRVNDDLFSRYAIKATPTIYLLDKENIVILKDCTPEQLSDQVNK